MTHEEHVALLRDGVPAGGVWADLGSGWGAFTLALADLLGAGATIHSVDRDGATLREQAGRLGPRFPGVDVRYDQADFTRPLPLAELDGVVLANALHFVADPAPVLELVRGYLRPGGRLILVEYDAERGNQWVPHPISFRRWVDLAPRVGFGAPRLLGRRPSRFMEAIYSALAFAPERLTN